MAQTLRFSHVHVPSLDLADKRYMLSPQEESPDKNLIAGINEYGLLHPPLVLEVSAGHFIIISGRKRIRALLQTHSPDSLLCLVMPTKSTDLQVYSLLLEHSLMDGPLSIAEQTAFFEKLGASCSTEEILPLLEKFDYRANRHKLDELLEMRSLSSSALQALHEGILKHNNARKLLRLPQEDQELIVRIIRQLHLGSSKQQRFITLSAELIMRRNEKLKTILQAVAAPMESGQQSNVPQRAATLLNRLYHECYPLLAEAETGFRKRLAQLELPNDMQVRHTPAFEDDTVTLSIRYANWDCLQQALLKIKPLSSKPLDPDT